PKPEVGRDLIVARAAGVELAREGTDLVIQQPFDECVYVLIGGADCSPVGETLSDAVQAVQQLRFLRRREYANAAEGVDPRLARRDSLRPQAVIDRQTAIQGIERFARTEGESAAPHLMWGRFRPMFVH